MLRTSSREVVLEPDLPKLPPQPVLLVLSVSKPSFSCSMLNGPSEGLAQ
jgi:hypothetical protein